MKHPTLLACVLPACALLACGGAPPPPAETPVQVPGAPGTQAQPIHHEESVVARCGATGGMTIEGQLGTLSESNVRRVFRGVRDALAECYQQRLAAMPFLAGHVELKLRVGTDGAVRWALPTASTLGDRETERCMMDHARALHFDAPCGGEAEVTFPLDVDGGPDNRPATEWTPSRLDAAVRLHRTALARCRAGVQGAIAVTLYVAPDGTVAAAGSTVPGASAVDATDCVVHEVATWRVASPGSWYARATIQLP